MKKRQRAALAIVEHGLPVIRLKRKSKVTAEKFWRELQQVAAMPTVRSTIKALRGSGAVIDMSNTGLATLLLTGIGECPRHGRAALAVRISVATENERSER